MWWRRRRQRTDEEFREEIRAHVAFEADRLRDDGLEPEEARVAAHRAFGNLLAVQERFHESHRWMWVEHFTMDLRYAWRGLRSSRSVAATLTVTLGVALALITAAFAVLNAYVLRPFAVRDPFRLYEIRWRAHEAAGRAFRWVDYAEISARTDLFDAVIAEDSRLVVSDNQTLAVGFVSANYFDALGPRVLLGRALGEHDREAGSTVAVLTEQAWSRLYGRDPSVLGRELQLNDQQVAIVGVMRAEFTGLDDSPRDVWVPVSMYAAVVKLDPLGASGPRAFHITARLRRGVNANQVASVLPLAPFEARVRGRVDPIRPEVLPRATPSTMTLETAVLLSPVIGVFLLILLSACANASNVMLARGNARHREIGVRLSIGASRNRMVRQLLTEALLISLLAGLLGLVLASLVLRTGPAIFVAMLPPSVSGLVRVVPLDFDYRVFLFALAAAGLTTIFFALLPALQATRLSLTDALRGRLSASVKGSTLRGALVATQVAVSLALLVGAATLVRNGRVIQAVDLGLRTDDVVSINTRGSGRGPVAAAARYLAEDSRIETVAVTSRNPLFGVGPKAMIDVPEGAPIVLLSYMFVSPEYFSVLDVPILRGRGFLPEEGQHQSDVAIVSANAARILWPGADPIGQTLRVNIEPPLTGDAETMNVRRPRNADVKYSALTVVGVARDVVSGFIYQGEDTAHIYLPTSPDGIRADALLVRMRPSAGPPLSMLASILQRAHPDPLVFESIPLREMVDIQMFPLRAASWIGTVLGVIALILSVAGLHGVLAYTLSQRLREIGIRMALGAPGSAVVRLVMSYAARMAVVGAAAGALFAFGVLKLLSSVITFRNVSLIDVGAFATSVTLVAGAVALASYGPARRATRVDPAETLRAEG